jgi:hypothetical protein
MTAFIVWDHHTTRVFGASGCLRQEELEEIQALEASCIGPI